MSFIGAVQIPCFPAQLHGCARALILAAAVLVVARPAVADVRLAIESGEVALVAAEASWNEILGAITQTTGTRFHLAPPPAGKVQLEFRGLTVQETLRRLLQASSGYVCHFRKGVRSAEALWPAHVWIVGQLPGGEVDLGRDTAVLDARRLAVAKAHERKLQKTLDVARNAADPVARLGAIRDLSLVSGADAENPDVRALLREALKDDDPEIRGQVLHGLAMQGGPEAKGMLTAALQDVSIGVRAVAIQSWDPQTLGVEPLQAALLDPDETIRELARDQLAATGYGGGQ